MHAGSNTTACGEWIEDLAVHGTLPFLAAVTAQDPRPMGSWGYRSGISAC